MSGEQIGGNGVEIWVGSFAALVSGKLGDGSTPQFRGDTGTAYLMRLFHGDIMSPYLPTHSDECRLRSAMRRRLTGTQNLFANKE
jgi:hypothetical protein